MLRQPSPEGRGDGSISHCLFILIVGSPPGAWEETRNICCLFVLLADGEATFGDQVPMGC